jgi:hypothetical protein
VAVCNRRGEREACCEPQLETPGTARIHQPALVTLKTAELADPLETGGVSLY